MTSYLSSTHGSHAESGMISSIETCIEALSMSCQHLELANGAVGQATHDLPRLNRVLRNQRYFDLVSETEVHKAQEDLRSEIEPQVLQLVEMARESIKLEERQMKELRVQAWKLQAQLNEAGIQWDTPAAQPSKPTPPSQNPASLAAEREVQMLRNKVAAAKKRREALSREVAELESRNPAVR